jgi:hypothetical protein
MISIFKIVFDLTDKKKKKPSKLSQRKGKSQEVVGNLQKR